MTNPAAQTRLKRDKEGKIRRMTESDLDSVLALESQCFKTPWSRRSFDAELRKPYGLPLVFTAGGEIAGYIVAWRIEDELHIANLAVQPRLRRSGIAENLLRRVLETESGVSWVGLEVRASNAPARALYRKFGFSEAGIRKGYYADEGEDAIVMVKSVRSE
jgi:[ribosomal protein S18]-alanine N-acetyltransferase